MISIVIPTLNEEKLLPNLAYFTCEPNEKRF